MDYWKIQKLTGCGLRILTVSQFHARSCPLSLKVQTYQPVFAIKLNTENISLLISVYFIWIYLIFQGIQIFSYRTDITITFWLKNNLSGFNFSLTNILIKLFGGAVYLFVYYTCASEFIKYWKRSCLVCNVNCKLVSMQDQNTNIANEYANCCMHKTKILVWTNFDGTVGSSYHKYGM